MKTVKYVLMYLWQLPQHLIALGIMLFLKITDKEFAISDKGNGTYLIRTTDVGVSLGNYIFLHRRIIEAQYFEWIYKHESGHSIQSKIVGWLYLLLIGIPSAGRHLIWKWFKLSSESYYQGYPEKWANDLVGL